MKQSRMQLRIAATLAIITIASSGALAQTESRQSQAKEALSKALADSLPGEKIDIAFTGEGSSLKIDIRLGGEYDTAYLASLGEWASNYTNEVLRLNAQTRVYSVLNQTEPKKAESFFSAEGPMRGIFNASGVVGFAILVYVFGIAYLGRIAAAVSVFFQSMRGENFDEAVTSESVTAPLALASSEREVFEAPVVEAVFADTTNEDAPKFEEQVYVEPTRTPSPEVVQKPYEATFAFAVQSAFAQVATSIFAFFTAISKGTKKTTRNFAKISSVAFWISAAITTVAGIGFAKFAANVTRKAFSGVKHTFSFIAQVIAYAGALSTAPFKSFTQAMHARAHDRIERSRRIKMQKNKIDYLQARVDELEGQNEKLQSDVNGLDHLWKSTLVEIDALAKRHHNLEIVHEAMRGNLRKHLSTMAKANTMALPAGPSSIAVANAAALAVPTKNSVDELEKIVEGMLDPKSDGPTFTMSNDTSLL